MTRKVGRMRYRTPAYFLLLFLVAATSAWAIQPVVHYMFRVYDDGETKEVTCAFCGYFFEDGSGKLGVLSANVPGGSLDVYFQRFDGSGIGGPNLYAQEPVTSKSREFEVDYDRRATVREGQTLKLRGSAFEFTLVDLFGYSPRKLDVVPTP